MSSTLRVNNPIWSLLPTDIEGLDSLAELALDLRWSWNHAADEVWRQLDPDLWALTPNPWGVLQTVSRDRIERVLADPGLRARIGDLVRARRRAAEIPAWFQLTHPPSPSSPPIRVAYFSMEYMLSEALPIYSGGLGNVAGDQLKASSDLGIPIVGVGLLYQQGYFRQVIGKDGAQQALFPYNDPGQLPITAVRHPSGEWLRLEIALPGYSVWLRAWQVQVGRVKLYLLDSNDAANVPSHRGITSELYGGGPELRLLQEIVLGIGGWRLLDALGIQPDVCHLNEGHAAFAVLERARGFMTETGKSFEVALAVTRAGNLFTTHTAVAAGFDRFAPDLIEQYSRRVRPKRPRHHAPRAAGPGPPEPCGLVRALQYGISGPPRERQGQRRQPPAREDQSTPLCAAVSALAGGRGADWTRHERSSPAELGLGGGRRPVDGRVWKGPLAGNR